MIHELAGPGKIKAKTARMTGCLTNDPVIPGKVGLYWNIFIDCEPIDYCNDQWQPSLMFGELELQSLENIIISDLLQINAECSFYIGMHDQAKKWKIEIDLDKQRAGMGRLNYEVLIDYSGMDNDAESNLRLSGCCDLAIGQIYVPRESFFPKPANPEEARALAEPFFPAIKDWHHMISEDEDGWPIPDPRGFAFATHKYSTK